MQRNENCKEINPETMKIIRNLRAKAIYDGLEKEHYLNQILNKFSFPMTIMENHAQKWCIENGIYGYEYIAGVDVHSSVKENERAFIKCIICDKEEHIEFIKGLPDHKITTLLENKGWDMEKEKCPKCNQ